MSNTASPRQMVVKAISGSQPNKKARRSLFPFSVTPNFLQSRISHSVCDTAVPCNVWSGMASFKSLMHKFI